MDPGFRSLLYAEPRLYDLVFPDAQGGWVRFCRDACDRHGATPGSVLDVGCGTGRLLSQMERWIADRWGLDLLESHVAYARAAHPDLHVVRGDMRSARLGRTFDLVTSSGNALSYALTDADLARAFETLAVHAHRGTLLVLDVLHARSYLEGDGFRETIEGSVDLPGLRGTWRSIHALDRAARLLQRTRRWTIEGRDDVEDFAEYRLLDAEELVGLLRRAGFEPLELSDSRGAPPAGAGRETAPGTDPSAMRGRKLYAVARRGDG